MSITKYHVYLIGMSLDIMQQILRLKDPALVALEVDARTMKNLAKGLRTFQAHKAVRIGEPLLSWVRDHVQRGNIDVPFDPEREGPRTRARG